MGTVGEGARRPRATARPCTDTSLAWYRSRSASAWVERGPHVCRERGARPPAAASNDRSAGAGGHSPAVDDRGPVTRDRARARRVPHALASAHARALADRQEVFPCSLVSLGRSPRFRDVRQIETVPSSGSGFPRRASVCRNRCPGSQRQVRLKADTTYCERRAMPVGSACAG